MIKRKSIILLLLSCLFLLSGCSGTYLTASQPDDKDTLIQDAYDQMNRLSEENQLCDIEYMTTEQTRNTNTLPANSLLNFADPGEWSKVSAPSQKPQNSCAINVEGYRLDFYDSDHLCVTSNAGESEWYSKKSEEFVTFYAYCNDQKFELKYHKDMGPF